MSNRSQNELMVQTKLSVTNTLRTLADAIENGAIKEYKIEQNSDGSIVVKADSSDGMNRLIQTQKVTEGYSRSLVEHIQKVPAQQRRQTVKQLTEEGFTQTQIAEKTMCSQKTISNDVKQLRNDGDL